MAVQQIILILVILLLLSWTVLLVLYYRAEQHIHSPEEELEQLFNTRKNQLPLLIGLMKGSIVKGEEVFAKVITLRQELLLEENLMKEKELSHQIDFLFSVADKHPNLAQDKRFQKCQQELHKLDQEIEEMKMKFNASVKASQDLRQKTVWLLFPGYWLVKNREGLEIKE